MASPAFLEPKIIERPLKWPDRGKPSTHELTYDRNGGNTLWVTGPLHHAIARVTLDLETQFFEMPDDSMPHGIAFDDKGRLWVTLEGANEVVQVDGNAKIVQRVDVRRGTPAENVGPHGLGVGPDGNMWFTGKASDTVGKIKPDGTVEHFKLPTKKCTPIYIAKGPDDNMWCTELTGNKIARITPDGVVTEFAIPTNDSRPIAVVAGPANDRNSVWFSEEAGHKVGRIDLADDTIREFPVPRTLGTMLLAALAFDRDGSLWTQSYVDSHQASPAGPDYLVKIDKTIAAPGQADPLGPQFTLYPVPSRKTVMHRIILGPDDNIWFTELNTDTLAKLTTKRAQ